MKKILIRVLYSISITLLVFLCPYIVTFSKTPTLHKTTLNVFSWGNYLPTEAIEQFQQQTGIKVNIHYHTTNEELIQKLTKQEEESFDVLFPSDYAVPILAKTGHLKHLDKSKLTYLNRIDPHLLNLPFDPNNEYSTPYSYEIYGLAYDKTVYPDLIEPGFEDYFNPKQGKIIMMSDPLDGMNVLAYHLFHDNTKNLTKDQKEILMKELRSLSPKVEAYADCRAKYYITSKTSHMALLKSSFISSLIDEDPNIIFSYPKSGLFTSIENAAITANSKNEAAAYQFINFLYESKIMATQASLYPYFPACPDAIDQMTNPDPQFVAFYNEARERKDYLFLNYFLPEEEIRDLWMRAKVQ